MAAIATTKAGIIFDFDDTLVYSHEQFRLAEHNFALRMRQLGLFDEDLLNVARARDIANVEQAGYLAVECFPLALAQTYEYYCAKYGSIADQDERQSLMEAGRKAYFDCPRLMEGAAELLAALQAGRYGAYRLILFTQGERQIQQRRIELSGLRGFFDFTHIVRLKDDAALADLLKQARLDSERTWYVGNSLRADVNPAVRAGLRAVHLAVPGWSYEQEDAQGKYHIINELAQLPALLRRQMEAAR